MPQGERNGDSLNTLFKKMLGYILRYVLDCYYDIRSQDIDDLKMQGIHNERPLDQVFPIDVNDLKMQGKHNIALFKRSQLKMLMISKKLGYMQLLPNNTYSLSRCLVI